MAHTQYHRVGGIIRTMAWDPNGERLAIVFSCMSHAPLYLTLNLIGMSMFTDL